VYGFVTDHAPTGHTSESFALVHSDDHQQQQLQQQLQQQNLMMQDSSAANAPSFATHWWCRRKGSVDCLNAAIELEVDRRLKERITAASTQGRLLL
jgi:hypothetical protein